MPLRPTSIVVVARPPRVTVSEPFDSPRFAQLTQGEVLSLPKDERERVEP